MWPSDTHRYGFLTSSDLPVPLKSISVDVIIRGFVADVVSELQYQNGEKNPVETTFVFPLDGEAAVYAFEGLIGGTRIEAQIREKKQAEQEYEDALSEGHQAFLLEREENTSDIFICNLGNLPPGGEATLKLRYVQALMVEPDDAIRFVLPVVLNPRYVPEGSKGGTVSQRIPRVSKENLPYTLSFSAKVESPYGISRVDSKCSLIQNMSEDRTTIQVSLAEGHQFDRDVELLVYYENVHKTSAILESGKSGAAPGSLMGDTALLLTMYPNISAVKADHCVVGEFIFLLDRSGSMNATIDKIYGSPSRIQNAKETLIFLLKSLPLGCYFNIYGFGSTYESFYPQSVKYTQESMSISIQSVKELNCNLGGTDIIDPLKAIYRQPCLEGNPRQIFVFTDGEVFNTDEVIAEVRRNSGSHRCFSFGIGEGASTALVKGIARAAGGSAEFITGKERMQAKALQSLKKALQPAVSGISLSWDLPSGLEAKLVGSGPQIIFQGQRCLIYAQIQGQLQMSGSMEGTAIVQYNLQNETQIETTKFSLQLKKTDRFPVHRLAAQALLQELEKDKEKVELALEISLSSGVVCSQTAYVGVNMELGKPAQGPLLHRDVPLPVSMGSSRLFLNAGLSSFTHQGFDQTLKGGVCWDLMQQDSYDDALQGFRMNDCEDDEYENQDFRAALLQIFGVDDCGDDEYEGEAEPCRTQEEEALLLKLVSLQNADGSWPHGSALATILDRNETEISGTAPTHVTPDIWATMLAVLWLHFNAAEQKDEWELLERKAVHWLKLNAGAQLAECVKAGNTVLGSSVSPQIWGL
ncbi:von Willebrand factor A domain-containing protein 5A-like isoform X2 [Erythrolamprus reginae]|uniref:von Willebrand factor A domain-containing protein 5A-like isoform X2 n=1 Tax=Erythrolamprus reginae TaxID=121349 RepID=UPI00396C4B70